MRKQVGFLLILLAVSYVGFTSQMESPAVEANYFGPAQYLRLEENLSLEEIRNTTPSAWTPIRIKNTNFGFDQRHYWFKVPLKNLNDSHALWFLRSDYPLLDTIDVYLISNSELVQEFNSGDTLPFSQRPIRQPTFVFPLKIDTQKTNSLYIHVQTTSSFQLALSLQKESQFWQTIATENAISASFYSILISMLFYNLVIFFIVRARSYLYYVLYLLSFTIFMASIHGWSYQFLWPNSPKIHELSVAFSIALVIIFSALFSSTFLRLAKIRPALNRLVLSFVWMAGIYLIATLIVPYFIMIKVGSALAILVAGIAIISTIQEWLRSHTREVLLFIIAWSTVLVGFLLYSGQKFGFLPINMLTEHAIELGAILEVILLALGLADRINSERKKRLMVQKSMLEVQIVANKELDDKVQERTKELEELNFKLKTASITDSLTQVKNRRYFDQSLSAEYRRAYRDKTPVSLLVLDVDHFKKINDTYGHQAGDEILKNIATTISAIANRTSDTVSRYGGEEFTVILSNTPKEGAFLVAERIRESIQNCITQWDGVDISITVSIGLASFIPSNPDDETTLLKEADEFLYLAKKNGRNQVIYEDNIPR